MRKNNHKQVYPQFVIQNFLTVTFIIFLRLGDLYTIHFKYNNAYFQNISESFSYAFFNVWKTLEQLKDKNRKGLLRIQNIKYKFKYLPHYQVAKT